MPFRLDLHALFFSTMPSPLEASCTKRLESKGVNRVNSRREIYYASPEEANRFAAQTVQSQLVECGQEGMVCSHALLGGDRVWLAQSLSPAG